MAGTQYRGVTAKNRRLSQRSRTLWRPMFLKYRLPKQLAGIERVLELPNRRSRIFPKTKPRRSIPQTRHRSARYPLHYTRQTVVVRLRRDSFYRSLLAILLRRLAESVISGKELPLLRYRSNVCFYDHETDSDVVISRIDDESIQYDASFRKKGEKQTLVFSH